MKPHVSRFRLLDAKDLLPVGSIDLKAVLLPSIQSLEGENRTETAALMIARGSGKEGNDGRKESEREEREVVQQSQEERKRRQAGYVMIEGFATRKGRVFARTLFPHVMHYFRKGRVDHVQICASERYNSSKCSRVCRTDTTPSVVVSVGRGVSPCVHCGISR